MKSLRHTSRAAMGLLAITATLVIGCTDWGSNTTAPPTSLSSVGSTPDVAAAIAAQERHTEALLRIPGVVGTAVGLSNGGAAVVRIFVAHADVRGLPPVLDDVPARVEVTGLLMAWSDPTVRARPAPTGFSVGHPRITAGTIGARVVDASGNVYVLSNNHVLANSNNAVIGDAALQPGPYDGGTAQDQIGTLAAFKAIDFSGASNTIDAAIAASSRNDVGFATPIDDGYGAPNRVIFGDANQDGTFDNKAALLNLLVQKYGRTTKHTHGTITGINASVNICYEAWMGILCLKQARFDDQIIITPGSFSSGGDSGSLIVTDDGNRNPVGLLFAGSTAQTIANRIDLVLKHFGVSIDDGSSTPPSPITDLAVTAITAPATATVGDAVQVDVTVRNVGNQDVSAAFSVSLSDATTGTTIGSQSVSGLAVGASAIRSFTWNTSGAAAGGHSLSARHDFADGDATNDSRSATVTLNAPNTSTGVHVGDLDGWGSNDGTTWSATVEVTVHDANHNPINGAVVRGRWSRTGLASDECTSGDLGGNGTCIMLFPSLKKNVREVTFTVLSVQIGGQTYASADNHDPDGSSNGTSVTVRKP